MFGWKMKAEELPLTEYHKGLLKSVIEDAYEFVEINKPVPPAVFLGSDSSMDMIVAPQFATSEDKNNFKKVVTALAVQKNCNFCIFVSEAWALKPEDSETFLDGRSPYSSISEHPKRIEVVCLSIEYRENLYNGLANIIRGAKSARLSEFKFDLVTSSEGRFGRFLP